MLQRGEPVDDGEFVNISTNFYNWGRYRKDDKAQFTTTHRREGDKDWFFVAGEGKGEVVLNTAMNGRNVEVWDIVAVKRSRASATGTGDGKTRVALDLPVGGSCFVVFVPAGSEEVRCDTAAKRTEIAVGGPWNVSFAYHDGITAPPPGPVVMDRLRDWTTYGEEGKAESTSLRYFSGTAIYKTTVRLSQLSTVRSQLSLGALKTGVAHVYVNGKDCGTVWCAPWKADVSAALREGENEIEIRYTNNWYNRLVGDCFLEAGDRVTRSTLQYWKVKRNRRHPKMRWRILPTVFSGPTLYDPLQPSGLTAPVVIETAAAAGK
jgi:hypothetical protein